MTPAKKPRGRRSGSRPPRNASRYVVPESAIREFVGSLGILDVTSQAARFQVVAELTSNAFENRMNKLAPSSLRIIEELAGEDDGEEFRRIVDAISAGVRQGKHGINAAHLTASRVVELAFRWTREYFAALASYREKLSGQGLRLVGRPPRRSSSQQSESRPANDTR